MAYTFYCVFFLVFEEVTWATDWRNGPNTRLLRKRSRVRFSHSTKICVPEHCLFVLGLGVFDVYVCIYKNKVYKYVYLSVI
jgi:hypothetical protein